MTDNDIIKPCGVVCGDNRFELIKKYKQMLFEQTNIETAKDQVAVIDGILFRFWQMGWLDKLEEFDRQKAEIDVLKTNNLSLCNTLASRARVERAEAIKEFAERVKQEINFPLAVWKVFDNLVKEMVGE